VVSFTPWPLYSRGKSSWNTLGRRLGEPQSRSGRGSEQKNSEPLPGLEPLIIQPVAQRYTTELSWLLCKCFIDSNKMTGNLNWKLCGRKLSWPTPSYCLRLRKIMVVKKAGLQAAIRTWDLLNKMYSFELMNDR
jgi:hypothetical protein